MGSAQIVEVARHLTLAAPVIGPAAAVPHLLAASDDALSRYAHLEAERHLRTALELISQLPAFEREALEGPVWARLTVLQLTVRGDRGQRADHRTRRPTATMPAPPSAGWPA